jgi:hypothetical protein
MCAPRITESGEKRKAWTKLRAGDERMSDYASLEPVDNPLPLDTDWIAFVGISFTFNALQRGLFTRFIFWLYPGFCTGDGNDSNGSTK